MFGSGSVRCLPWDPKMKKNLQGLFMDRSLDDGCVIVWYLGHVHVVTCRFVGLQLLFICVGDFTLGVEPNLSAKELFFESLNATDPVTFYLKTLQNVGWYPLISPEKIRKGCIFWRNRRKPPGVARRFEGTLDCQFEVLHCSQGFLGGGQEEAERLTEEASQAQQDWMDPSGFASELGKLIQRRPFWFSYICLNHFESMKKIRYMI